MQKKLLLMVLLFVMAIFLSGCTENPICGDEICQFGEDNPNSSFYCTQDCGTQPYCGDQICSFEEDDSNSTTYCPKDCETQPYCGDGICNFEIDENKDTCEEDCKIIEDDFSIIVETTKNQYETREIIELE